MKFLFTFIFLLIPVLSAADKPNILFILTDDQRFDNLSCYGNEFIKTPEIDKLAAKGTRFTNMFVTTSICAASRASIFTGLFETTHGFTFGKPPIPLKAIENSYPALLRQNGYKTGFTGKFGVKLAGGMQSINKMFDTYKPSRGPFMRKLSDGSKRHCDEFVGDDAVSMIEDFKDNPFCISVSFRSTHADDGNHKPGDGHFPYPKTTKDMYDGVTFPMPKHDTEEYRKTLPGFFTNPDTSMNRYRYYWRWDTKEKYQKNMQAYARMTTGIDTIVGRMVKKLKELNLDKKTIIIYTADNGFFMGNRGFAGKWSHYEESLRVPLVIFDPRQEGGKTNDKVSLNIDLTATMLAMAGITVPEHYQGKSLTPLLEGKSTDWRKDFFCEHRMNNKRIPKWRGIRDQRFVYANYYEEGYEFLHDLEKDPEQLKNLAKKPEYKELLEKMRKESLEREQKYKKNPILK